MQINFNFKGKIMNYDKKRNRQSGRQKKKSTWEQQYKQLMDEINTLIEQGVLPPVDSKLPEQTQNIMQRDAALMMKHITQEEFKKDWESRKNQPPKSFAKQPILG
jgi:hypothetical protein